jgi:hypothetical protein
MTKNSFLLAEQNGQAAFQDGSICSYDEAERASRERYKTVLERYLFVAGWNQAFWDEQGRELAKYAQKQG